MTITYIHWELDQVINDNRIKNEMHSCGFVTYEDEYYVILAQNLEWDEKIYSNMINIEKSTILTREYFCND